MSTTATAADQTGTGADAINALSTNPKTRSLDAELRIFRDAKAELKALTDLVERSQEYLVERLESETLMHSRKVDDDAFTVVRSMVKHIDVPRALKALKRRRMFKDLTKVVVMEDSFKLIAAILKSDKDRTPLYPDFAACISETPKRPYIKIS